MPGIVRYDVRAQEAGWQVVDRHTGRPAAIDGVVAERLDEEEAGEIADLLNTLEILRGSPAYH